MVMAGGTGGHVFPALAVAEVLRSRGNEVFWLGAPNSFESRVVPEHGFSMEMISIKGVRGNGVLRWLAAPFKIMLAMYQALRALRRHKPSLVLGMGGFVSGPGALAARLLGIPLVIHEQNAIPGLTNQWLAYLASRVLEAFPGSFAARHKARVTGNPVRREIVQLPAPEVRMAEREGALRLLVLGGSLGAQVLNETLPAALKLIAPESRPLVCHQAGRDKHQATQAAYAQAGVAAEVVPFISDMAAAYAWADLVVCRSGALTVAELAAAGVGALLVPYPYAVDDHQTKNARYLADRGAAVLLPQDRLDAQYLATQLEPLLGERAGVLAMAKKARALALADATLSVANICEEVAAG